MKVQPEIRPLARPDIRLNCAHVGPLRSAGRRQFGALRSRAAVKPTRAMRAARAGGRRLRDCRRRCSARSRGPTLRRTAIRAEEGTQEDRETLRRTNKNARMAAEQTVADGRALLGLWPTLPAAERWC